MSIEWISIRIGAIPEIFYGFNYIIFIANDRYTQLINRQVVNFFR